MAESDSHPPEVREGHGSPIGRIQQLQIPFGRIDQAGQAP